MALSRSILNVSRWLGAVPKVLKSGRLDAHVGAVASGLVGIKSIQGVTTTIPSNTTSVGGTRTVSLGTSVNILKSFLVDNGPFGAVWTTRLTGTNTITQTKRSNNNNAFRSAILVVEFY